MARASVFLVIGSMAALAVAVGFGVVRAGPATDDTQTVREGPQELGGRGKGLGELVGDVPFVDLDGKAGRLSDYRGHKATVICFTGAGCPVAKKYGPTIAELEQRYRSQGVAFLMVNPDAGESTARLGEAFAAVKKAGFGGRYVHDKSGDVARRLAVSSSTEAFVLDAALTLVYRGAVDDQFGLGYALPEAKRHFLADAIDATLAGEAPPVRATSAPGCALDFANANPAAHPAVTWNNRVSRIAQQRCQACHRPGEPAPFSLLTYADAQDHFAMMKKVIRRGVMPPWFADPKVGHWANDPSLSDRERADLLGWLDAGAPEGDAKDAPLPRRFVEGWKIGKPDAVFKATKAVSVPAKGPMKYQYLIVSTNLPEDKWVQAVEIRTPNWSVVHHLLVFMIYPGSDTGPKAPDPRGGLSGYFAGLVPGQAATTFPAGAGKRLPKGAQLLFQIHYTPDGTPVEDQPEIGFVFAKEKPEHELLTLAASNNRFRIPPGEANYAVNASYRFDGAARIISFMPHSHVRGKAYRYEMTYPDGRTETVLDVPRYDFNWQLEYHLAKPLDVPAGSVLRVTGWYDNSASNPANPDPTKWVKFGEQTTDEMMIGYFTGYRLP